MVTGTVPDSEYRLEQYRDVIEWPLLRLFTQFSHSRRGWFSVGLLAGLFERAASLVPPFILGVAIDAVFTDSIPYELPLVPAGAVPPTRVGQLWFSFGIIFGCYLLTSLLATVRMLTVDYFTHHLMHVVRTATYDKIQRLDVRFFDGHEKGELMSILNNDISNFEQFFDDALTRAVRIGTVLAGSTAILLYLNWQLAVVTLGAVPLLTVFTLWFMRRVEPIYDAIRSSVGGMNTRLENNLGGITLIKTMTTEAYESGRVRAVSARYFETNWERIKLNTLYHPGSNLITNLSFAATFLIGGYWVVVGPPPLFSGSLTVGSLVTFLFMSQRFTGPLKQIAVIIEQYENARASGKRVVGLMDMPVAIEDLPDATELTAVAGHVEYDDVCFGYEPDEEYVLNGISFDIDPGETVAFVGPTGAGKSTVVRLLMRMYETDEGSVSVDGHDVRDVTLSSLRDTIGYVSQEHYLFGGTVKENITYGTFDASDADVVAAAKAAQAHQFITELPDGYETAVGEEGVKLSGGQRQRIALARVVLSEPEILVLDEATSDVDTETEMLIQRSLDEITVDRTTVVIAHRLSTIRDADTIFVLDDGEIAERGSHEALLDEDGLYANLWKVQAGEISDLPEEFVERVSRNK
ncbi:multidrug ABC transporter ATP-binding protein [Haloarcula mannanilytica]|uniref:Multidrug ABC transporter ATP-binding protein n=1 Tax=Haloarcula mannanilytica TaxID=2509225 RepID=A0A4C2ENE5_9EURY|nr:ABC transporter ATP-binding protein [Haloarcula mannanilytica]GCF15855.1 multidrug ABC transporter ATP-binding protein [Haloarcula mannanilytica]